MQIRSANEADINELAELYNSDNHMNGLDSPVSSYSEENMLEYTTNKKNMFLVCEKGGEIVGAALTEIHCDYFFLHTLIGKEGHREQGIASVLMERIKKEAANKKVRSIELFTETSNEKATNALEKHGFDRGKTFYFYQYAI